MARLFTGASSEIAVNTSGAPVTAVPLTIVAWVRLAATGTVNRSILALRDHTNASAVRQCFELRMSTAEAVQGNSASGSASVQFSAGTLTAGTWAHAAAVFATTTSRTAYKDGTPGTEDTTSNRTPTSITSVCLGGSLISTSTVSQPWDGDILWPAIWNVALNADEMAALSAGVHPRRIRPANLVFFVEADDQRHIMLDAAQGAHLTLTGTQYVPDIPPLVAARNPKRTARIYAFPSGGSDITLTQGAVETLSLTEYAGVTGVSIDLTGALETLALTEYAGTTGVEIALTGNLETLTLTEYTGTVDVGSDINLTGTLETLSLTEYAGTTGVSIDIAGALETLALTEYAGTVSVGQDINLTGNLETLALTEYAGVVGVTIDLTGTLETLVLTEYTGTVDVGSDISLTGNLETLALTEYSGQTGVSIDIDGALETLALTEYQGTVSITNDIVLSQGAVETLALTEYAGVTSLSIDLTGTLETLSLTEFAGLPGVSMDLVGALETLTLTEYQGTLQYSEAIALVGNLETLALTEFAGTITLDVSLTGTLEMLTLTEYAGVLRLYDPLARVWRVYTWVDDERRLETTVTTSVENSFITGDEADTFVTGI